MLEQHCVRHHDDQRTNERYIMATYNPPAFPRRLKQSTLFSELRHWTQLTYYRYEINTALYVMSPGEKLAYNIMSFSFAVLLLSAVYYYLPPALYISTHRLTYYFTGTTNKLLVARVLGSDVRQGTANVVSSLSEAGRVVNSSVGFAP